MTIKTDLLVGTSMNRVFAGDKYNARITHETPDLPKDPVDPPKDPVDPPKDPQKDPVDPPKDPTDPKPSDAEAKLLKEVMEKKAEAKRLKDALAAFGDLDPVRAKELLDGEVKREAARKKAELTTLEQKGEFERVKTMMAEEHKKMLDAATNAAKSTADALTAALSKIDDLTVGAAFSASNFVKDELVLTAAKARALYGSHFALEDGVSVAYDKPAGAKERTKLVDASGEPLDFDAALAKIVESDPDRDTLKKSKLVPGAGSGTTNVKKVEAKPATEGGLARIRAALAARKAA
jgi:hypothetical protein